MNHNDLLERIPKRASPVACARRQYRGSDKIMAIGYVLQLISQRKGQDRSAQPVRLLMRPLELNAKEGQRMVQEAGSDLELVRLVREGKPSAFERLVERFQDRVYRLALRISGNQQDAEEITRDVFLTIYQKIGTFEARDEMGRVVQGQDKRDSLENPPSNASQIK